MKRNPGLRNAITSILSIFFGLANVIIIFGLSAGISTKISFKYLSHHDSVARDFVWVSHMLVILSLNYGRF